MIHEDGTAKITDFGVAKIVSQQMTLAGTMMGTPSYMSPEQVQGGAITGRADQFSLAVIAYEVLTGEKPFAAEYLPTLLYKIVREEPAAAAAPEPHDRLRRWKTCCSKALAEDSGGPLRDLRRIHQCAGHRLQRRSPRWMPLPRGASHNMPTVGSQEGLVATVAASHRGMEETVAAVDRTLDDTMVELPREHVSEPSAPPVADRTAARTLPPPADRTISRTPPPPERTAPPPASERPAEQLPPAVPPTLPAAAPPMELKIEPVPERVCRIGRRATQGAILRWPRSAPR